MSFKTILVHLNDARRIKEPLAAALSLARRHGAHLIGIYVVPPVVVMVDAGAPMGGQLVTVERDRCLAEAGAIRAVFEKATSGQTFTGEWRTLESEDPPINRKLLPYCRAADLIITNQSDPNWELSPLFDEPETLVLDSGRPVLIIPYAGHFPELGSRIMIAWNNKREAARAAFDALPFLKVADEVRILSINPQNDQPGHAGGAVDNLPTAAIAHTLARHGVKAVASESIAPDMKVGDELLSRLADQGTNLLVMGCYGHSRFSEMVFGGVTRNILKHMTVPVLMSH